MGGSSSERGDREKRKQGLDIHDCGVKEEGGCEAAMSDEWPEVGEI